MKFILVEDDEILIQKVKDIISKVLFKYDIDYDIDVYMSCNSKLKHEIEDYTSIKTYILSVDINQSISGIDIGEYIRKNDYFSNIIFLTNHDNMFETVHRRIFNVFEFIEKYHGMDKRLEKDIKRIVKYYLDSKLLKYEYKSSLYTIPYKSIKYIVRDTISRKLFIYTNNKIYKCNMSIKKIIGLLDNRFIRVSKSTIVNSDYMEELNITKGYVKLFDNTLIDSVSKKYVINV